MDTRKMTHRMFLLLLLCVGDFGVFGQSDPTSSLPSQPSSSDNLPSTVDTFPTPTRVVTYPPTPLRNLVSTPTSLNPSPFPSDAPTALTSVQATPFLAARTTPPRDPKALDTTIPLTTIPTAPLSTLPSSPTLRGSPPLSSMTTNLWQPTMAATTVPIVSPRSTVPQRCQLVFSTKLEEVVITEYDLYAQRTSAQRQLADFCGVVIDRITNIAIESSPSGNLVLRFTIEQGSPVPTEDALSNLQTRLNTTHLQLSSQPLLSPTAIYWTDNGPCPTDTCLNNAICDVTLSSAYTCSCDAGYTGSRCQDRVSPPSDNRLLALLVLLIIPIAVAVIVGFVVGRRRQQREQLKKAFDLRDVRTIGPRSMLSLPTGGETVGIRNQMYDTRSFAMAFTDTTFSKSSPTPSSNSTDTTNDEDNASNGEF